MIRRAFPTLFEGLKGMLKKFSFLTPDPVLLLYMARHKGQICFVVPSVPSFAPYPRLRRTLVLDSRRE